jgi:phage-related protein
VKLAIAYHTLSVDRFIASYYPVLKDRYPRGVSSFATLITAAWDEITGLLRGRGLDIDRMIDCAPLEPALAAYAAYKIATNFSFGNDTTSEHQQWAMQRHAEYASHLEAAIARFPWYETGDDLVPGPGETNANLGRVRFSR